MSEQPQILIEPPAGRPRVALLRGLLAATGAGGLVVSDPVTGEQDRFAPPKSWVCVCPGVDRPCSVRSADAAPTQAEAVRLAEQRSGFRLVAGKPYCRKCYGKAEKRAATATVRAAGPQKTR